MDDSRRESPLVVPLRVIHARNDVDAKTAFVAELRSRGIEARIVSAPADVLATVEGVDYFFEIKKTSREGSYFGAATLTEWEAAIAHPSCYFFVTAQVTSDGWVFHQYTPEEFMRFSTVPPFKIFFQIPVGAERALAPVDRPTRSIRLTEQRVRDMSRLFAAWRKDDAKEATE